MLTLLLLMRAAIYTIAALFIISLVLVHTIASPENVTQSLRQQVLEDFLKKNDLWEAHKRNHAHEQSQQ